ncbi:tripartite tricarboxylate transporter substrate binding protein, partial [Cupriavidus lacunae]|uniref:tripartite tricarboxylate transporter substrate binding protein n=1 Tax=Cupriavidus lacunae TaxID=2666307 RepID=UPI001058D597
SAASPRYGAARLPLASRSIPWGQLHDNGPLTVVVFNSFLWRTPYDALKDLRPLTTIAFMPLVLMTSAEKGPATLEELMRRARRPDARVNYGSSGIGSLAHLTGFEFARRGKLDMTHIPYQGGSLVATGLLQGDIQCSFVTSIESASLVQSGKMRVLGVAARHRLPSLPNVPAIAEELPGFESVLWFAAFAPKGTREDDAKRLRDALVKAVESPEFRKYLADHYAEAKASTPEELTQLVRRDMLHWADVARTARISM